MRNRNLTSFSGVFDAETGVTIHEKRKPLVLPSFIRFPYDFCKIYGRAKLNMSNSELGKFVKLTDFIEYSTNRLVDSHIGKKPIPLNQQRISIKIGISTRATNS